MTQRKSRIGPVFGKLAYAEILDPFVEHVGKFLILATDMNQIRVRSLRNCACPFYLLLLTRLTFAAGIGSDGVRARAHTQRWVTEFNIFRLFLDSHGVRGLRLRSESA